MGGKCPHRSVKKRRCQMKRTVLSSFKVTSALKLSILDELLSFAYHVVQLHTQLDAELAAGMGMPDNGPKLMSM
ncbi:hypothetical protein K1719_042841 [Acacia pycnantha]|nr:hypothetical protein K1719_042841 [Acacia pycnantha]